MTSAWINSKYTQLYNVSSQKQYTVALLDRYRKALETAVQISCRYNVPPLPGRTVVLLTATMDSELFKGQDFCLPRPDPEQKNDDEEEDEVTRRRKKKEEDEDKLTPSVRTRSLLIISHTSYSTCIARH